MVISRLGQVVRFLMLVVVAATVVGCDQDPLGSADRFVTANYYLKKWEDGTTYYLGDLSNPKGGAAALVGPIDRIGWNTKNVVVEIVDRGPERPRYIVIDIAKDSVSGQVSAAQYRADNTLSSIRLTTPAEAWERLPWRAPHFKQ